ncbi:chemotaxis-specific protein-glutamate methyltransferase CheB [Sphingomonas montanisoli]|uniref:protein-glutamate methylesterase n=1 Tax=Sphingomonas montanisoli TaxID=2606412 RepID=A0A5D9CBE3_9SPHN|nr:chemotaxis-specific protein-glutamate methyltransferase CheB [Sphingomonas montanisoli]TZG28617.1 chemotaxis-specific protein-glutamate methyltransferase CheB [Sphingomonas montanisoli]
MAPAGAERGQRRAPGGGRIAAAPPIRILLVDDSLVARTVLARLVEGDSRFEVAGAFPGADRAIDFLRTAPVDIVVLDVEMPGKDGLTALPEILEACKGARVLIVSSAAAKGAAATMRALTLGAADTLLKPTAGSFGADFTRKYIDTLLRLGHRRKAVGAEQAYEPVHVAPMPEPVLVPLRAPQAGGPVECLAIGASTGGLHALSAFLQALPKEFDAPILVTQHLPPVFMSYFANQLRDICGRPAKVAQDGMRLVRGEIIVAPGEGHIRLIMTDVVRIRIDHDPAPSRCMPSVDPMFEAVAELFGPAGVGIVLTGMGRDGTIGARNLVEVGAEVLAQDSSSSVVWGMPGSVARAGLANVVAPPAQLAACVAARGSAWT